MFLMRQRIYNTRYYVTKEKKTATGLRPQAHPKDHQKLYQNQNVELKRKKANLEYIKQLMELTVKDRRKTILEIDDRDPSAAVLEKFPFLNQELEVSSICPGTKERYDGSHGGYRGREGWRGWRTCRSQVTCLFSFRSQITYIISQTNSQITGQVRQFTGTEKFELLFT